MSEENVVLEENSEKKENRFNSFMKKNGFYIGVFLIFALVIIIMTSDKENPSKGVIDYSDAVFYQSGNQLYLQRDNKEAVLLSASLLQDYVLTQINYVIKPCKISKDGNYVYFFENVILDGNVYMGDLCRFTNNKKETIGVNVPLSYALSADYDKVVYATFTGTDDEGTYLYDLYLYENGKSSLIDSEIDKECITLSGDGKTIIYHKGFYADTQTTAMYVYKNGASKMVDNQVVYYYKQNANGTFKANWPLTNYDGSKIIYAGYMGPESLPSLNLYTPSDQKSTMLVKSFVQVFVDDDLNNAAINGETSPETMSGSYIRYDLNTLEKEIFATNIWGLCDMVVAKYVTDPFINLGFYLKSYDEVTNTADLYFKGTDQEETKVLSSINVDNIQFSLDYKSMYALAYYYAAEGGELHEISNITTSSYDLEKIDEMVMEYHFDDANTVLGFRKDVKLYLIDKSGTKKMIDNHDVSSFEITPDGNLLYFYKDGGLGTGELYMMEADTNKDYELVDKAVTFIYEFGDNYVAFVNGFDFGDAAGTLIVTDGKGNFQIIAEKVSTLLMKNYIK
ncbi:MAG: hypothetical protein JXQ23_12550 [Clostridia bacterium]|nr:hypothetical protein [Clostridia bacterium]